MGVEKAGLELRHDLHEEGLTLKPSGSRIRLGCNVIRSVITAVNFSEYATHA